MADAIALNDESNKGKDETLELALDGTNYSVSFDVSDSAIWLGNKTIKFTGEGNGSATLKFSNDVAGQLRYSTDENDLVVEIFGIKKQFDVFVGDESKIIGTVRIFKFQRRRIL